MIYEARKINKAFSGSGVIKNFSLKLEAGEFVGIVGKRGSGMTTLIHILTGILKPDSGEIYYKNKKAPKIKLNFLRRNKIAYIPTEPILMPEMDIYDNMLVSISHKVGSDRSKKKKARDVLKTLGLKGKGRFYPRELSLIERQKVCIARAVLKEPDIIFCDEPADILEGYDAEQLMEVFEILNAAGYTIVMTTHSKRVASRCHRVVPIGSGVVLDGLKTRSDEADEDADDTDEDESEETDALEAEETEEPAGEVKGPESGTKVPEVKEPETKEPEKEEPEEDSKEAEEDTEDDFSFDDAIAAAALAAIEDDKAEIKTEDTEEEFSYDDYSYTELSEDEKKDEAEDDDDDDEIDEDMWTQLVNRKNKTKKSKAPEDILPELDLKDIFKNQ